MKILYVAAEVSPLVKVGGLADVAGSLPQAIKRLGHDIRVVMPGYGGIDRGRYGIQPLVDPFRIPFERNEEEITISHTKMNGGVPLYLVENQKFFGRENVYGYEDDELRFALFGLAVARMLEKIGFQPEVINCNDWHSALIANLISKLPGEDQAYQRVAAVFTIHNLAYQGIFDPYIIGSVGLDENNLLELEKEREGKINLMARGIFFSDVVTTVSEEYAKEIQSKEYGAGLEELLADKRDRLFGILNGVDYQVFSPQTDPHIAVNYNIDSLDHKGANKKALQRECGFEVGTDIPLMGMISRLTDQKGLDILAEAIRTVLELGVQFVVLGTGDFRYQDLLTNLAEEFPYNMKAFIKFDAALAQRIYAGCDMFVMPSRFEPCGLGQLISMAYGTIPIVRRTGGLADTVKDFDPRTGTGMGFVFHKYNAMHLLVAMVRALEYFRNESLWRSLMERAMSCDFSWDSSAKKYEEIYKLAIEIQKKGY